MRQHLETAPRVEHTRAALYLAKQEAIGRAILRYGLVALLFLFGAMKFTDLEAQAIRPLVEHSPFMSWMIPLFGMRGTSDVIGVIELAAAILIALRRFKPAWSAAGSIVASLTFVTTLSFLFTTPGIMAPDNPFGGFIMKDVILLGAALYTAGEAFSAARAAR
jgi:uncharacterized membrane protein YkgB